MSTPALSQDLSCCDIEFMGAHMVVDPAGCLYWPGERTLVVSDLHLEKGSSLAARGVHLPPYDSGATLARLAERFAVWMPKRVICLGDSFHDDSAADRLPGSVQMQLRALMQGREWVWICGNHDPSPPACLGGVPASVLHIGGLMFRHEPLEEFQPGEIAGHLHPVAKIRRRGKVMRRRCVAGDGERMILPAFGSYTGGLNVIDIAYQGLFRQSSLRVWMLGRQAVYQIAGNQLVK